MPRKVPSQGKDKNAGVYPTPRSFLDVVEREFGPIKFDLAASAENAVAPSYFTEADDSLAQDWSGIEKWAWLNPPYDHIGRWAKKCALEAVKGASIIMLVPASVGSNWYRDWVEGWATVRFLNGRITFVGHDDPYPKDLMLCIYGGEKASPKTWNWRV